MTAKQCEMLKKVSETGFAMYDTGLFLDTHPCDEEAQDYYEKMRVLYCRLASEYSEIFSPLCPRDAVRGDRWVWADGPQPWHYEANVNL